MIDVSMLTKDLIDVRARACALYMTATDAELDMLETVDGLLRRAITTVVAGRPSAETVLVADGIPEDWAAMAAGRR